MNKLAVFKARYLIAGNSREVELTEKYTIN